VAGRSGGKGGGKGGRETRRCEREKAGKFRAGQKIGFNKPDLLKSGSNCPIIRYRVHLARFSEFGFNYPDLCFFYFFSITAQKAQNNPNFGFPNPDLVISGSSNPILQIRVPPPGRCIISEIS
jgi:hypothetical protein